MLESVPLVAVLALLATSVAAVVFSRPWLSSAIYVATLVCSAVVAVAAGGHLLSGHAPALHAYPLGVPWLGTHFRLDALSAVFLLVIGCGGAGASLFAVGYGRHEPTPKRVLPFYPAFLAGMILVAQADDAFTFLVSWEFMSLASWALVMAHHREAENSRAGYVYLIMAAFGTVCLLLAFGLLAGPNGNYSFAAMRAAAPDPGIAGIVVALALIGAGSKAGIVPLHAWLPLAHPAAPSHVSALMSGVMTKVAIYALLRIIFDLAGGPAWWWGLALLLVGGVTSVLGILYAFMQRDLKRMLAYSTIENVGLIVVCLGLSLAFEANGQAAGAALALTAALFHVLNHSLFKSLLFFGTGAVLTATGTRDMERLGGLIHRMPATSVVFLVGCAAISALPPLNGFVSEWLAFQAILISPELPQWALKLSIPAVGALLALAAALAAACFVKAFGIAFLGRPRSDDARNAHEVDRFSLAAMLIFAALCVLAGILPGIVIDALAPATSYLVGATMPRQATQAWMSIVPIAESRSSYNGLLIFFFIAISASLAVLAVHRLATQATRRSDPWDCGFPDASPMTQYTAGSFGQPIRRVFALVFQARERVEMPPPGSLQPARFEAVLRDLIWDWLYAPIAVGVGFAAERLNTLQFLTIRSYLMLVFVTLVTLLTVLALWP